MIWGYTGGFESNLGVPKYQKVENPCFRLHLSFILLLFLYLFTMKSFVKSNELNSKSEKILKVFI
jgi:hypothetical protein